MSRGPLRLRVADMTDNSARTPPARMRSLAQTLMAVFLGALPAGLVPAASGQNLLANALRYATRAVDVRVFRDGPDAAVAVEDDGPGIPTEQRAEAVKRFKQVGAQSPEGVGLGLAIVDACARLHRGTLALEDNGPGLRARLSLAAN